MMSILSGLKSIYLAPTAEKARMNLDAVSAKWSEKYPHSMNRWYDNWDAVCPIFKFSMDVRKVIYTTNAIESVNSTQEAEPPEKRISKPYSTHEIAVLVYNADYQKMVSAPPKLGNCVW